MRPDDHAAIPRQLDDIGESKEFWMRRCSDLAQRAVHNGEAAVGAVIVRDKILIAEGAERVNETLDISGHAEIIVIRTAARALGTMDLAGCTLYTNKEPCWMCSFAIRESGIGKVVIGSPVEEIGGATSRYPILTDPDIAGWRDPPTVTWLQADLDAADGR